MRWETRSYGPALATRQPLCNKTQAPLFDHNLLLWVLGLPCIHWHFGARDTCFSASIHSVHEKPLFAILSLSFLHLSAFRQTTRRTGSPGAGADVRSQTAPTKAHLTGPNQTSSHSFPSYKVDTLRWLPLDLSSTFKLLVSQRINIYIVIKA